MRIVFSALFFTSFAGAICGCANTNAGSSVTTQPMVAADSKAWVMQAGGMNVLKISAAPEIKCVTGEGTLHFTAGQYEVEFWLMPGAKTVDQAVGSMNQQIVSEFKDFKPEQTNDLSIAGSPAKRLVGTGHEADDGDPGDADVILFKVGNNIFAACNHGESLNPAGQQAMLSLVQTAQPP